MNDLNNIRLSTYALEDIRSCRDNNFVQSEAYNMLLSDIKMIVCSAMKVTPFRTTSILGEELLIQRTGISIGLFNGSIRLLEATISESDITIYHLHPDLLDGSSEISTALSELATLEEKEKSFRKTDTEEDLVKTIRQLEATQRELNKDLSEIESITPEIQDAEDRRCWVFSRIDATRLRISKLEKVKSRLEAELSALDHDPDDFSLYKKHEN